MKVTIYGDENSHTFLVSITDPFSGLDSVFEMSQNASDPNGVNLYIGENSDHMQIITSRYRVYTGEVSQKMLSAILSRIEQEYLALAKLKSFLSETE